MLSAIPGPEATGLRESESGNQFEQTASALLNRYLRVGTAHVGLYPARMHRAYDDVVGLQLQCQHLHHLADCTFGAAIGIGTKAHVETEGAHLA